MLGPDGGSFIKIFADPGSASRLYASAGSADHFLGRIFASMDAGATWSARATPEGCTSDTMQVRADGHIFIDCNAAYWRSGDGTMTWQRYTPLFRRGILAFDPFDASRAALVGYDHDYYIGVTSDDGATWAFTGEADGAFVPTFATFDPLHRGRLVGVGTRYRGLPLSPAQAMDNPIEAYVSDDDGRHWTARAVVLPSAATPGCFERSFVVARDGRQFLGTDCGWFASHDAGATWTSLGDFPGGEADLGVIVDEASGGRLVRGVRGQVFESRDSGLSWRELNRTPTNATLSAADAAGNLWAFNANGVFRYADADGDWSLRQTGLTAHRLIAVEPAATSTGGSLLTAIDDTYGPGDVQSRDGGTTWQALTLGRLAPVYLARNVTLPNSLFAMTADRRLLASDDGGLTWSAVADQPVVAPGERIDTPQPVGTQPGLAYATYQICLMQRLGCVWVSKGFAISHDGGRTWAKATDDLGSGSGVFTVNPSDPLKVLASGGFMTRDGGASWRLVGPPSSRFAADPSDSLRWYAFGEGSPLATTADDGKTWSPVSDPLLASTTFTFLVDGQGKLYAVGTAADVAISRDHGTSWRRVAEPTMTLRLEPHSMRLGLDTPTALYATGNAGVVKFVPDRAAAVEKIRAVEFFNAARGHYFLTANPLEIAGLDYSEHLGWKRTGEAFSAYPPATALQGGESPVCRFYGRPEHGLDSHFYSASPVECRDVADRFGTAWMLESSSVFSMLVPSQSGACAGATTPVYRVFNNRADVNHRYTTSRSVRDSMIAASWIPEGYGPDAVAMCAP